jgi:putative ABC transport system permease protein
MQDLRLAFRALRRTPVVSTVAVLSLALGIGANTAIFSLVNSLLLRTLPVAEPERLASISSDSAIQMGFNAGVGWNYPMWEALRQRAQTFDGALAWSVQTLDLAGGGERQPVQALLTSGDFFTTLGVRAAVGRTFSAADDVRGGGPDGPAIVISHDFWHRRFQGSTTAIGAMLSIERVAFRVIGVTPPGFTGLEVGRSFDVALPLASEALFHGDRALINQPRALLLFTMLRLKPGQSVSAATVALRTLQKEMHGPLQVPPFAKEPFTLVPAAAGIDMPGSARPKYGRPLMAIFAIVAMVLLIACANIANLLLARASARRHEVSVRMAMGASRWRVARLWLIESVVLAAIGAACGLVLAFWSSRALVAQLALTLRPSLDWRVLAFTAGVTLLTALLFGAGAMYRTMRVSPIDALKQQGRGVAFGRGRGISNGLVVAQVALSLVLVTGAGLFVRSFTRLTGAPLGFDRRGVLLARVDVSRASLAPQSPIDFYDQLAAAVTSVPGVLRASSSVFTPLDMALPREVKVPGAPPGTESERIVLGNRVAPGWFATYGTAIQRGRDFDSRDTATSTPVVIINETFARKFFPGRDPLGQSVSQRTVIGVVTDQIAHGGFHADGKQRSLRDVAAPTIYEPMAQFPAGAPARMSATISIRIAGNDAASLIPGIARALKSFNPDVAFAIRPMAAELDEAVVQERIVAGLSGFFGVLAVLLAGLGLYGVTSYAITRRRSEIGIRLALGASPGSIVRLVLSAVAVQIGLGIVAGVAAAIWAGTLAASLLYGLTPRDPAAIAGAILALLAVALFAGGLPALRASRIDPVTTLRED